VLKNLVNILIHDQRIVFYQISETQFYQIIFVRIIRSPKRLGMAASIVGPEVVPAEPAGHCVARNVTNGRRAAAKIEKAQAFGGAIGAPAQRVRFFDSVLRIVESLADCTGRCQRAFRASIPMGCWITSPVAVVPEIVSHSSFGSKPARPRSSAPSSGRARRRSACHRRQKMRPARR
jgi:hypothetical protein